MDLDDEIPELDLSQIGSQPNLLLIPNIGKQSCDQQPGFFTQDPGKPGSCTQDPGSWTTWIFYLKNWI